MEGSGLRSALKTVYAPVAVRHMFTGKAFSRAVRGHLLTASAIITLFLQRFWNTLTQNEQNHLTEIYESENPRKFESDETSLKLVN